STRYDSRTTTFSPEGRLYQVEYAVEAVNHAGAAIGIKTDSGVVIATEKRVLSKLLENTVTEKVHRIDTHIVAASAGVNADAEILVNTARLLSQQHKYKYGQSVPVELLVQLIADQKQGYTQFGGLRPYGVSFIFAGWDQNLGFQLYQSDPSGNYVGWQAIAIGANCQTAHSILKSDYSAALSLTDAKKLALTVLKKIMGVTTLSSDTIEMMELARTVDDAISMKRLSGSELSALNEK
ncbi:nucleophile aminohydrolase, partial [Ostreococcus tauri]